MTFIGHGNTGARGSRACGILLTSLGVAGGTVAPNTKMAWGGTANQHRCNQSKSAAERLNLLGEGVGMTGEDHASSPAHKSNIFSW